MYLGAYGWLQDVRLKPRTLSAVELSEELAKAFGDDPALPLLMRDFTNGGFIHAPSLSSGGDWSRAT